MFFVMMDWFEDGVDSYRGMKVIPILDSDAKIALFLAHDIAYNMDTWKEYEKPHDVYVFHSDNGIFDEDDNVICSFLGCDKFNKCIERKFNGRIPKYE
jgi:hypothetical protein